jgi:hypothetical protein
MKFRTTEKITGEIVLGGLNLVLKRGVFFDLTKDKIGHHELVWAIHNGYVEAIDNDAKNAANAEKKVYTNSSKKIIVSQFLKSPLNSGDTVVLLKDDPTCVELDKLVAAGLLSCSDASSPAAEAKQVKAPVDSKPEKITETRKSFKKKPSSKKEDKKDNTVESSKITSDAKPKPFVSEQKTIFVGSNNEELELD